MNRIARHKPPTSRRQREPQEWIPFTINGVLLVCVLVGLAAVHSSYASLRVGQVAPQSVVAERQVTFIDHIATAARRKLEIAAVVPRYRTDTHLAAARLRQAEAFLTASGPIVASTEPLSRKIMAIRRLVPPGISPAPLQTFPSLTASDFAVVQKHSLSLLRQAESWPYDSNQLNTTEFSLLSTLPSSVDLAQRTAIGEVLQMFLAPTLVLDSVATEEAQQHAAASVPQVVSTIKVDQVIVRRGDLITPTVMEELTALGIQSRHASWQETLASILFATLVVGMLFWYLRAFFPGSVRNGRILLLIDVAIVGTVAATRLLTEGHILLPYFLPVAAMSTFAAVLIAPEASIAVAFAMAVLAGWVEGSSFELTLFYFLTSAAGVLAVRGVYRLKQFIIAGALISLFAFTVLITFGIVGGATDLGAMQEYVLAAAFNGFLSSTLALGGFALLSSLFGVTTTLQLLELAHPSQLLLRRLMVKAPGTYNHSLIVATMVERAGEGVGANTLVAKVGALYHDVGKTANPHCFAENQLGIGNVHDELPAVESARIIKGHVTQGIKLAKQHRLPGVIVDAISEHHGTMSIAYFLHKAVDVEGMDVIDPAVFTYAGPRPRSKETALLMLADGCESTVRAAPEHSPAAIREIVQRTFDERMRSGQLNDSPLTLRDLEVAREAFCSVLNGLYHPRVEYPEPVDLTLLRRPDVRDAL